MCRLKITAELGPDFCDICWSGTGLVQLRLKILIANVSFHFVFMLPRI